jgi:hypothetical protein
VACLSASAQIPSKNDFSIIFKLKNYFQKFYFEKGKGLDKSSMQMQGFEKSNMQFWK